MKRQNLFFVVAMILLLLGCQDQLSLRDDAKPDQLATKAGVDVNTAQTNERYVFLSEKDFKAWTDIVSLEDRLAACEVPASTLQAMTTDALVRTALNYPLNFIYSAYNDPFVAVDIIVKNSPLHQELFSRSDAAEVLLHYFKQTSIDKSFQKTISNRDDTCLTYANEMFFEYLLASRISAGLFTKENLFEIRSAAQRKLEERLSETEVFSEVSLAPLKQIIRETSENSQSRSFYYWQWYTPFNTMFRAEARTEMTDTEIYYITWLYTSNYQNAGMIALASNRYNGNGYAWMINDPTAGNNNSATTSNSWLYDGGDSGNDIADLWTNALYDTSTQSAAERIYYYNSDHTAMPYSSVNYISKWGEGPLMEHAPTYCPYLTTNMTYYSIRSTATTAGCAIAGLNLVTMNTTNYYSVQPNITTWRGITSTTWIGEGISTGTPSSFSFSGSPNTSTCSLTCYVPGTYKITFEGKYNGTVVIRVEKYITCSAN